MKASTEKYMSMEFKKFHNKILKHMKTFGVTIYNILIHFIGNKLGLYVSFWIPLYLEILQLKYDAKSKMYDKIEQMTASCTLWTDNDITGKDSLAFHPLKFQFKVSEVSFQGVSIVVSLTVQSLWVCLSKEEIFLNCMVI